MSLYYPLPHTVCNNKPLHDNIKMALEPELYAMASCLTVDKMDYCNFNLLDTAPTDIIEVVDLGEYNMYLDTQSTLCFVSTCVWEKLEKHIKKGTHNILVRTASPKTFICKDFMDFDLRSSNAVRVSTRFYHAPGMNKHINWLLSDTVCRSLGFQTRRHPDFVVRFPELHNCMVINNDEWERYSPFDDPIMYKLEKSKDNYKGKSFADLTDELIIQETTHILDTRVRKIVQQMFIKYRKCVATKDRYNIGTVKGPKFKVQFKNNILWAPQKPYPIKHDDKIEVDLQVNELLKANIAEELWTPPSYSAPVFLVAKAVPKHLKLDTSKPGKVLEKKMVMNFSLFNDNSEDVQEPEMNSWKLINQLRDFKHFTSLDIRTAYCHIEVDEETAKYYNFTIYNGRVFRLKRMMFGAKQAPSIWNT